MARRPHQRTSATARLRGSDARSGTDKRSGATAGRLRAAERLKTGRQKIPNYEQQPEATGEEAASAGSRSSQKNRRKGQKCTTTSTSSRSQSLEERKARAAAEAAKKKKRAIALLVFGGIAALLLLIFSGTIQRKLLFRDLRSKDARTRKAAVRDLLTWRDQVRPGLIDVLKNKSNDWPDASRFDAAVALASLRMAPADKALKKLALAGKKSPGDDDKKIRGWVVRALVETKALAKGRFPARVFIANAGAADKDTRLWSARGLGAMSGKTVVDTLIKLLDDDNQDVRNAAITSFEAAARPADTLKLLDFIKSDDQQRQDIAKAIFSHFDSSTTIAVLGKALEKADNNLTLDILGIYNRFQCVGTMPEIVASLIASPAMKVRVAALHTAGHRQLKGTEDKIETASHDDIPEVRIAVAKAVDLFGRVKLCSRIHHLLTDSDAGVRKAAMKTVISLKDRGAAETLIKLLDHDDKTTRQAAISALQALFPLSRKKWGGRKAHTWKKWWGRYKGQLAYIKSLHKTETKILDLLANQDNKSYKRVLVLIKENEKWIRAFLADKDKEVVPEILAEHGPYLKDLVSARKMGSWRYESMKCQTR